MSHPKNNVSSALRKTVLYSSLFHFPLTLDELWRYVMSDTKLSKDTVEILLKKGDPYIVQKGGYYFLRGEENALKKRKEEQIFYDNKLSLAKKAASLLSFIPTILFIGVSGSLAAGSAPEDSDIDFFIITSTHTVWITRLLSLILLSLVGLRRKRSVKHARNKICLNIFVSESEINYFTKTQDIYTARELAQVYPLLNRHKTYEKLLKINNWYLRFLPNATPRTNRVITWSFPGICVALLKRVNSLAALLQMNYMKKHQTTEVVTKELLLFHPHDYHKEIMDHFQRKLIEYDLLTKV